MDRMRLILRQLFDDYWRLVRANKRSWHYHYHIQTKMTHWLTWEHKIKHWCYEDATISVGFARGPWNKYSDNPAGGPSYCFFTVYCNDPLLTHRKVALDWDQLDKTLFLLRAMFNIKKLPYDPILVWSELVPRDKLGWAEFSKDEKYVFVNKVVE